MEWGGEVKESFGGERIHGFHWGRRGYQSSSTEYKGGGQSKKGGGGGS